MTYEDSIKRLGEILNKLEKGGLPLDEALELYKEGVSLSAECKKQLEDAKLQVKTISEENDEKGSF